MKQLPKKLVSLTLTAFVVGIMAGFAWRCGYLIHHKVTPLPDWLGGCLGVIQGICGIVLFFCAIRWLIWGIGWFFALPFNLLDEADRKLKPGTWYARYGRLRERERPEARPPT